MTCLEKMYDYNQTRPSQMEKRAELILPEYKGPKAIGQIFGISYIYSIFWKFGLIRVPAKVQEKLMDIK